jgi:inositol transporter-like SP family MFS transporter
MPLFLAGGVIFIIGLLIPVVFGFNLVTILAALGVGTLGQISCGEPIARVWGNESFPTLLRSTGQGIVFTFGRVISAIASAFIPGLILFNPSVVYVGSAVAAVLGVLIGYVGFRGVRAANEFHHEQEPDVAAPVAAPAV